MLNSNILDQENHIKIIIIHISIVNVVLVNGDRFKNNWEFYNKIKKNLNYDSSYIY